MTMLSIPDSSNHSDGSMALRDYFNELYLEKSGESVAISSDVDSDGCEDSSSINSESESDVSLSSDEETFFDETVGGSGNSTSTNNDQEEEAKVVDEHENDGPESKINSNGKVKINTTKISTKISGNTDLNDGTNHTRRRRFRRSRALQTQRLRFAVASDNARVFRTITTTEEDNEKRISTYHNNNKKQQQQPLGSSKSGGSLILSASAHSLGSRTGISNTSVNKWRMTIQQQQQKKNVRSTTISTTTRKEQHRDSRWSCSAQDGGSPTTNSKPKSGTSRGTVACEFGFGNDSLHRSSCVRNQNRPHRKKRTDNSNSYSNNETLLKNNTKPEKALRSKSHSCGKVIDSAVRVATALDSCSDDSSNNSDSEGEDFYHDDDYDEGTSISSFTMDTLDTSRKSDTTSTSTSIGTSLVFGGIYRVKSKAAMTTPVPSSRAAPERTRSFEEKPRLPTRTQDSFDIGDIASETFEPLKGGGGGGDDSVTSSSSVSSFLAAGFQKPTVKRSVSTDSFMTFSNSSSNSSNTPGSSRLFLQKAKRRASDPVGRWAATITSRKLWSSKKNPSENNIPSPPRRVPSASMSISSRSRRTTGRNSNHSNDSSSSDDDSSIEDSCYEFHNDFSEYGQLLSLVDDDSLAATMATTGSSNAEHSSVSTKDRNEAIQMLLPNYSGHNQSSHMLKMPIPESLRKLPHSSFHGCSTISSKSFLGGKKHPGKSLHSTTRKWT